MSNIPIPAHNHIVGTRNSGLPEWWNVQVIATADPATFNTLTSVGAINAAVSGGKAVSVPTNVFLFFQVLAGTDSAAMAANLTRQPPPRVPPWPPPRPHRRPARWSRERPSTT